MPKAISIYSTFIARHPKIQQNAEFSLSQAFSRVQGRLKVIAIYIFRRNSMIPDKAGLGSTDMVGKYDIEAGAENPVLWKSLASRPTLTTLKAKFHYARWFEAEIWPIIELASSELARASRFAAKFHYAVWFKAGRRPASNLSVTSFKPASV